MKITRVEPILIQVPFKYGSENGGGGRLGLRTIDTLFVRIETDEGIVGWGEAFGHTATKSTKTALESVIAPLCIGEDPTDVQGLTSRLRRRLHNFGLDGPFVFAISGIDIALWDIAAKAAGLPLYKMLGGSHRTHLPVYASLLRYANAKDVARNVEDAISRGYSALKLHEIDSDIIYAARKAAGDSVAIYLDASCAWNAAEAVEMSKKLQPSNLAWLEEPVWPPDDYRALAHVNAHSEIPVAAGENTASIVGFREMFRLNSVTIVQPSVTKAGGISAIRKIMMLAEAHGVRYAPHSPYFGPGYVATIHLLAANEGNGSIERYYCDLEASPIESTLTVSNGMIAVPQTPGLGIDVDEAIIARYRTG